MFVAQVVKGPLIPTLEKCPKALDPVCVRHATNIFASIVVDLFVIEAGHAVIPARRVGEDLGTRRGVACHKGVEQLIVGVEDFRPIIECLGN